VASSGFTAGADAQTIPVLISTADQMVISYDAHAGSGVCSKDDIRTRRMMLAATASQPRLTMHTRMIFLGRFDAQLVDFGHDDGHEQQIAEDIAGAGSVEDGDGVEAFGCGAGGKVPIGANGVALKDADEFEGKGVGDEEDDAGVDEGTHAFFDVEDAEVEEADA